MRIFVTGASGWIGSALVPELLDAGHEVVGLARSDASEARLKAAGVGVHRGDVGDLDGLREAAAAADGVVHLAFNHDFSDYAAAGEADLRAVEAIGAAIEGTGKPFVITSGTAMLPMLAPGRLGTEDIVAEPGAAVPRVASEGAVLALAERGVRTSVVRLAPSVHGRGDKGFVARMVETAREKGVSAFIGDGANRWPGVHRLDAAHLFRLAVESAPAGSVLHGAAEEGVPVRDIAEVIGRHLDLPVESITAEQAPEHFGFLAAILSLDNPTSNALTRKRVEWNPVHPGLIADLEEGHYFNG
ncbi:SDR family oxidoreductase [Actinomadura napierensis]|uniref:SDR family oxidoreductase n=1 Tax=Actinomadura napierensis TaxID=267854 RepID=A0ABN3A2D3_9ACTN